MWLVMMRRLKRSAVWLRRRLRRVCYAMQSQSRALKTRVDPTPDPRFAELYVVELGVARRITLAEHHAVVARTNLAAATRPTSSRR